MFEEFGGVLVVPALLLGIELGTLEGLDEGGWDTKGTLTIVADGMGDSSISREETEGFADGAMNPDTVGEVVGTFDGDTDGLAESVGEGLGKELGLVVRGRCVWSQKIVPFESGKT